MHFPLIKYDVLKWKKENIEELWITIKQHLGFTMQNVNLSLRNPNSVKSELCIYSFSRGAFYSLSPNVFFFFFFFFFFLLLFIYLLLLLHILTNFLNIFL